MSSGIYAIGFMDTNRLYVGRAVNLKNRMGVHTYHLKNQTHHNKGLQNHFNKYGIDRMYFEVLEETDIENLAVKEADYYLEKIDEGYELLNSCGFVGQDFVVHRNGNADLEISEGEFHEIVTTWQTQFLSDILPDYVID